MKVRDIMNKTPTSCRLETNLAAATELMWNSDCGTLPVVDTTGKVLGMITDRDIAMAVGTRNRIPSDISVGEVVTEKVFSCAPDDDIHAALKTMQAEKVRRLPVVNKAGQLQGILCLNDIALRAEKRAGAELSYADVVETLKAICEHRVPMAVAA